MYNNYFKFFVSVIILSVLLFGCSLDESTDDDPSILAKLGIDDATNLFIAPSVSSSSSIRSIFRSTESDKLFKITSDGYIQEVTYLDENDQEMTIINIPTAIYNVNTEYIIVLFGSEGYLVRKSDGAVFSLTDVGVPSDQLQQGNFINAEKIQTDVSGNIYYQITIYDGESTTIVIKIDVTDPNNLTKTDYTPDTDYINGFNVTSEGHISYNYGSGDSNRIKKSNGGLYNLPSIGWLTHWVGLDDKIRYQKSDLDRDTIVTVSIDPGDFTVTTSEVTGSLDYLQNVSSYLFKFIDRTVLIETGNEYINELENPTDTPRKITISEIDDIKLADASANYYYLSGDDSSVNPLLLKVNPVDDSVTTLLSPGLYDIINMTVSSDDTVIFNALRMSDGVKIIGEIDSLGTVTILDEIIDSEIVILERIN